MRAEFLRALDNVLERERSHIMADAPAETWLGWIDTLLPYLNTDIVYEAPEDPPAIGEKRSAASKRTNEWPQNCWLLAAHQASSLEQDEDGQKPTQLLRLARRFTLKMRLLRTSLLRERGAYQECLNDVRDVVYDIAPAVNDVLNYVGVEGLRDLGRRSQAIAANHSLYGLRGAAELVHVLTECLIHYIAARRHCGDAIDEADHCDIALRALRVLTSPDSRLGQENRSDAWNVVTTVTEAELRFEGLRTRIDAVDSWNVQAFDETGRNVSLSGAAAATMGQVGDLLKQVVGFEQALYSIPFDSEQQVLSLRSRLKTLHGRLLILGPAAGMARPENFDAARRVFEEAENGVVDTDFDSLFLRAIVHRLKADALQKRADWHVMRSYVSSMSRPDSGRHLTKLLTAVEYLDVVPPYVDHAQTLLRAANHELQRTEEVLRTARRNIRAWKRLYAAQAQQAIEELLLIAVQVEASATVWADESQYMVDVQQLMIRGLEAVRGGMDCILHPSGQGAPGARGDSQSPGDHVAKEHRRILAKWTQLLIIGRALIQLSPSVRNPAVPQSRFPQANPYYVNAIQSERHFCTLWGMLNESVGLDRLNQATGAHPTDRCQDKHSAQQGGAKKNVGAAFSDTTLEAIVHRCDRELCKSRTEPHGTLADNLTIRERIWRAMASLIPSISKQLQETLRTM